MVIYEKALTKATAINSKDHMSSIAFSMAVLQLEMGDTEAAIKSLQNAKISANKIEDKEFKVEIDEMLTKLLPESSRVVNHKRSMTSLLARRQIAWLRVLLVKCATK